jgi:cytochrome P450
MKRPTTYEDIFSIRNVQDSVSLGERLREMGPVVWAPRNNTFVTTTRAAMSQVLSNDEIWSAKNGAYGLYFLERLTQFHQSMGVEAPPVIFTMDGEEHKRAKRKIVSALGLDKVEIWRNLAKKRWNLKLDQAEKEGGFDAVIKSSELSLEVISDILGIPYEGMEMEGLSKVAYMRKLTLDSFGIVGCTQYSRFEEAVDRYFDPESSLNVFTLTGFLNDEIDWKRNHPGDDLLTTLINSEYEVDGEMKKLTPMELNIYVTTVLLAGNLTTTSLIGAIFKNLAERPEVYQEVREREIKIASGDMDPRRSLVPFVVQETLRYDPPGHGGYRLATEDTTLGGVKIKKGEQIFFSIPAAGRDPAVYENPNDFDVHRKELRKIDGVKLHHGAHSTYGKGGHTCPGRKVANLEGDVTVRETVLRIPEIRLPEGYKSHYLDMSMFRHLSTAPILIGK